MLTPLVRLFSLVISLVILGWVVLLLSSEQELAISKFVFVGTNTRLELEKQSSVSVLVFEASSNQSALNVPKAHIDLDASDLHFKDAEVNVSSRFVETQVELSLASGPKSDSSVELRKLLVTLTLLVDNVDQRWQVASMSIDYDLGLKANCTDMCEGSQADKVAFVNGVTDSKADRYCANDYTICAPINLCWRCTKQRLLPDLSALTTPRLAAGLVLNGFRLQPILDNAPNTFGYDWDCDPLLTAGLWQALLVSLFLASILLWAMAMVADLKTPVRFDGPNDKPLHVPLND